MPQDKKNDFDFRKIKIKQEKLSPTPEKSVKNSDEIIPKLFSHTPPRKTISDENEINNAKANDDEKEEKKPVEPLKSSNEILAELFKVFNAAPPKTLLNDENLLKKKKHKKGKKHKKKSKKHDNSRTQSDNDSDDGSNKSIKSENSRNKKKHHKKKKKKKKSEKADKNNTDRSVNSDTDDDKKSSKKRKKNKSDKKSPPFVKNSDNSEFVISDEDEYLKEKTSQHSLDKVISKQIKIEIPNDRVGKGKDPGDVNSSIASSNVTNARKIIIKNIKDSKIFKDAQESSALSPSKHDKKRHHQHHHHHERSKERDKESKSEKQTIKSLSAKDKKKFEISPKQNIKRESSEISLSDEETYLREKELVGFYKNSNPFYSDRKNDKYSHRGYYNSRSSSKNRYKDRDSSKERNRSTSKYRSKNRWRNSRSRSRSRSRYRERSRSRSRSRENGGLGIDKKYLLEVARKNAISMFKNGSLPGTQGMTQEVKNKVLMRMRYGGKSVEELTEFCKKLSQGENLNELSDLSSNDDSDHDKDGKEKAFHHPFVLKDRGPIVMNIKNATQIPPKTAEQSKAILMQYPVSSGQQHRLTENEWVPVSPKRADPSAPSVSAAITPSKSPVAKNIFQKPLPQNEEQKPAFVPTQLVNSTIVPTTLAPTTTTTIITATELEPVTATVTVTTTTTKSITAVAASTSLKISPIKTTPTPIPASQSVIPLLPPPLPPVLPIDSNITPPVSTLVKVKESIFPQAEQQNIDVSTVIAKRLNAMRKLQENPTDPEALKMMYDAQKNMSAWASSKYTPGQFTGSTGANILSAKELQSGFQAWARRDQLTSTTPVSGGMGMHLLQKMGWKPGEGLGKTKNGALQPLLLDVKMDKRGLVATEEDPNAPKSKRRKLINLQKAQKKLEQKHPVSLLDEISAKRKWGPPVYDLATDDGPAHKKNFIFNVVVNGVMYQPTISSRTKKEAKALAAKYCLQQLGILGC